MAPVHEEADYMRRVVVVDDDELSRRVVARRLKRWGFTPVVFGQAEAVLCYLQTHDACALVSDLEMPECDGLSLARAVLALRPELPILLLTARCEAGFKSLFGLMHLLAGMDLDQFIKPYHPH